MRIASFLMLLALAVPAQAQISLPIDFEAGINYELQDFGGAEQSMVVADPTDGSNMVTQTVRPATAECFAGTTVADVTGFTERIPFTADAQTMSVRVWSPEADVLVLFKVEEVGNPALNVETYSYTTVAGGWETMVFDFADPKPNTNPVQPGANYNKASIFFDFQCDNVPAPTNPAATRTYYWDDVEFGGEATGGGDGIALPIDFESDIDYELQDFGGNMSMLVADPTDGTNTVVQSVRTAGAECFAGTTVADVTGFTERIAFTPEATTMSVRVWSPEAGIRVLFKVEEVGNGGIFVETLATTTQAGMWETLVFDFANPMPNGNPIQFGANYNKASIFFDFQCDLTDPPAPPERTYYWDDVTFDGDGGGGGGGGTVALPVTFEDDIDYELVDFGGNMSMLVADPTDGTNTVVQTVRTGKAQCFAGTTVADATGFTMPIPFTADMTTMSVRVWSPEAGIRVLLKVEQVGVPEVSVETVAFTTVAGAWETLVFDFGTERPGTAALNLGSTYNKASIFFDFSCDLTDPPTPPERTYYWDDVAFGGEAMNPAVVALPITFEEEIDYELQDFGGNVSSLVADPTDSENTVVQSIRTAGAEFFAGTTVANVNGFVEPIPFADGMTTMYARIWTPVAGTPVRFKVEQVGNPGISVETEVVSTVGGMWETMLFDFSDQVPGTAEINFESVYNKGSFFFNFGEEGAAEATTYYWDDVTFGDPPGPVVSLPVTFEDDIDYGLIDFGGAVSQIIEDPTDAENTVVETVRTAGAEFFAGTTIGGAFGFTEPVPFTETMTRMSIRVWAPAAGTAVRVKLENADDPSVSVETQVMTTVGMAWQNLTLNFANEFPATPMLDLSAVYNKASVFFDFDTVGATEATTYYWDDLAFGPAPVSSEDGSGDSEVRLAQNAPNPFRAQTEIRFSIPTATDVQLHVYNALGQKVATLAEGPMAAGDHAVTLDGRSLASGTYVYRLVAGSNVTTRSMIVVR